MAGYQPGCQPECAICYGGHVTETNGCCMIQSDGSLCPHRFHLKCIKQYLDLFQLSNQDGERFRPSCPICRCDLMGVQFLQSGSAFLLQLDYENGLVKLMFEGNYTEWYREYIQRNIIQGESTQAVPSSSRSGSVQLGSRDTCGGQGSSATLMESGSSATSTGHGSSFALMEPGSSSSGLSATSTGQGSSATLMEPRSSATSTGQGSSATLMEPRPSATTTGQGSSTTLIEPSASATPTDQGSSAEMMEPGSSAALIEQRSTLTDEVSSGTSGTHLRSPRAMDLSNQDRHTEPYAGVKRLKRGPSTSANFSNNRQPCSCTRSAAQVVNFSAIRTAAEERSSSSQAGNAANYINQSRASSQSSPQPQDQVNIAEVLQDMLALPPVYVRLLQGLMAMPPQQVRRILQAIRTIAQASNIPPRYPRNEEENQSDIDTE